jgi:hypothetical protein
VGAQFVVCTGSVALVAATAKTVIEIPTGALQGFLVIGLEVSFSATTAGSAVVEWGTYTTTGTGTTVTATKYGQITDAPAAALGTVKTADSVEPTSFVTTGNLPSWVIPLPGMYSILYPAGREFYRPASTLSGVRVNSTVACNVRANLYIEQ